MDNEEGMPRNQRNSGVEKSGPDSKVPAAEDDLAYLLISTQNRQKTATLEQQNRKLKADFLELKTKLEDCLRSPAKLPVSSKAAAAADKSSEDLGTPQAHYHATTIEREQKTAELQKKMAFYRREIKEITKQLEDGYNINKHSLRCLTHITDRIIAFENEEKEKRKIIEDLEGEKQKLRKLHNKGYNSGMDAVKGHGVVARKDELYEQLREKKAELKEKQLIARKQERQIKEQHEFIVTTEEKTRKLRESLSVKKPEPAVTPEERRSPEEVQAEIRELEMEEAKERKRYKQLISTQETALGELTMQLERLNVELKQKDQECRMDALKISEMRRQVKLGASSTPGNAHSLPQLQFRRQDQRGHLLVEGAREKHLVFSLDQFRKDMRAEMGKVPEAKRDPGEVPEEIVAAVPQPEKVDKPKSFDKLISRKNNK